VLEAPAVPARHRRLHDDDQAIDVHTLAVHGTTASWTKDGTQQTANLAAR
jgi:hypothetical protein